MVGYIQSGYDELRVEDRYVSKLQKVYLFISHPIQFHLVSDFIFLMRIKMKNYLQVLNHGKMYQHFAIYSV